MLVEFKGMFPDVEKAAFIAPNAAICGDVAMDEGSSVWFSAVIRGEVAPIRIGKNWAIACRWATMPSCTAPPSRTM